MRATTAVAALAAVAALVLPQLGGGDPDRAAAAAGAEQQRPNIVVVMSDDQTLEEMRFMPRTERLLGSAGATFPDTTTNWPICCPSRATFFTGQYAHNHGVLGNSAPMGGYGNLDVEHTLPVWLQRSGYSTIHIGKFVNGYETSGVGVPPGWSEWHGSKRTYAYYGYELFEDGRVVTYGSLDEDPDDPADPASYSTDVYTDKAVERDRRAGAVSAAVLPLGRPTWPRTRASPNAGGGAEPCADTRQAADPPRRPARRRAAAPAAELQRGRRLRQAAADRRFEPLTPQQIARTTRNYRCRGESLFAIDEGVKRIVEALRANGELRDTLLIYTSDNGFFHGEHRIGSGKNRVYEEAVRVPLLIRGPGIPRGVEVADIAGNADIAATIAAAAGARPDHPLGRPLAARFRRAPGAPPRSRAPDRAGRADEAERQAPRHRVPGGADQPLQVRPLLGQPGRALRHPPRPLRAREPARRSRLRRGPGRHSRRGWRSSATVPASRAGRNRRYG